MNYSFFGTCADDHKQFFGCLDSILEQSVLPKEIILVNSGKVNIEKEILNKIKSKKINLIYIAKQTNRVKALNIAIDKSMTEYSFRFDSRSRFSNCYAENALKILSDKSLNAMVVGGVPNTINVIKKFEPILCSYLMNRAYIFFNPKHRNYNYCGYASSIYLGCFKTNLLKEIRFNEKEALLSEDSLIVNDFLKKGFKAYLSSKIKLSYVCRRSFISILKLFNTYGFCRANTIFVTQKLFISKRHFFVFISLIIIFLLLLKISFSSLIFLPLILFSWNLTSELISYRKHAKVYLPFYATLCQFSWILGFIWNILTILKKNKLQSNFIS